jgi:hypothetical protein
MMMGWLLLRRNSYEIQVRRSSDYLSMLDMSAHNRRPMVAWFSVSVDEFRFPRRVPKQFRSSPKGTRGFCPDCGNATYFPL